MPLQHGHCDHASWRGNNHLGGCAALLLEVAVTAALDGAVLDGADVGAGSKPQSLGPVE